jgi:hypothetical protein
VERSHRSDQEEFSQLLTYKDDVDVNRKPEEWERFYNYHRLHEAFTGKTPYEAQKSSLTVGRKMAHEVRHITIHDAATVEMERSKE